MPDTGDLSIQDRIEKLEKKLKLSNLLTGKKFADLELTIGKLGETLKEISTDFPEIKEKSEEIEDLLNVINLGIISYKESFDEFTSRFIKLEKIPEEVKAKISNYEKRLKSLEDDIKKISDSLNTFNTLKEDITKTVEEKIIPKIQMLSESSDSNKTEIEHIKKNIDAFSSALKSFERTVELTNLDVIIKRFDSIEDKIMKAQSQIEKFRDTLSTVSIKDKDIEILKQKLKDTESVVLEKLGKLNEVEMKINILQQKLDDLNFFDIANKLKSELKGGESIALQNQARIEELTKRLDMLSQELEKKVEEVGKMKLIQPAESGEVAKLDVVATEESYKRMEEMYNDMLKRISDLKSLDKELRNIELPPSLNQTISKFEERLSTLEKNYNESIKVIEDLWKSVKEVSKTEKVEGIDELKKQVKEVQKVLTSWDKNITDYRKQLEKRLNKLEEKKVMGEVPKYLVDELSSLREMMIQLSAENKEFKKLAREVRISQMASVDPETFANVANKVSLLEKKIVELEEKTTKKPAVKVKKIEDVEKLKKEVEDRIKQIEKKVSEESLLQLKSLEEKIKQIEKKLSEESSVKPIILE